MFTTRFGIEIEFTGITRNKATEVTAKHLNATIERTFDSYDTYKVTAQILLAFWELNDMTDFFTTVRRLILAMSTAYAQTTGSSAGLQ